MNRDMRTWPAMGQYNWNCVLPFGFVVEVVQIDAFDRDLEMVECVHTPFDGTPVVFVQPCIAHGFEPVQIDSVVPCCTRNLWRGGKSSVSE